MSEVISLAKLSVDYDLITSCPGVMLKIRSIYLLFQSWTDEVLYYQEVHKIQLKALSWFKMLQQKF